MTAACFYNWVSGEANEGRRMSLEQTVKQREQDNR
jgi:hypothetical protein